MPLDAICTHFLAEELNQRLAGGRIDKVQQPERDMVMLSLRTKGENVRLLLAAGTGNARCHLTRANYENPAEPPMFCMLLRKHLVGARVVSIRQPDWERMLILDLDTYDEMGVSARKQLVVEMIGRSANIVLVGEDGRILDCMRRVDFAGDAMRSLQPGRFYRLPPKQEKIDFFACDAETLRSLAQQSPRDLPADQWLLQTFSGLSPMICRELAFRSNGSYETLPAQMEALQESVAAATVSPCLLIRDGKPQDLSFMAIRQYGAETETQCYADFSTLLDAFYSRRDQEEQRRRRSHELTKKIRTARDRLVRKLSIQREELRRTERREELRCQAELITANLYRIGKGDSNLRCENYFEENCPLITIPLDPLKTPQQNAAALYRDYRKQKAARLHLTALLEQGETELDYLNSVLAELEQAETERDLAEIRRELAETGYLKKGKTKSREKGKAQAPMLFLSDDGFEILVGRNNAQNDELTTRLARRTDWWFHTQKIHGSHVVLRCEGQEPGEQAIEQAASLAVYYSQGREGGKLPVDYTQVRNVRKPSGSLPGKVIYSTYRTLLSQGDEELARRLRRK